MAQMTLSQLSGWNISGDNYKDFVYNPKLNIAEFINLDSDDSECLIYVGTSDEVRLWMVPINNSEWSKNVAVYGDSVYSPLYKSHVQKAIRRKMTMNAIDGVLALLYTDPSAILRRLAIIAIEDVCLIKGYSVIVWLMMSVTSRNSKKYILTNQDVENVLNYVENLCGTERVYIDMPISSVSRKMITSLRCENRNEVLSLWYRKRAGGMKGDMKMLENATAYYFKNPTAIEKRVLDSRYDISSVNLKISILSEAVDFHPFPQILSILERKTHIPRKILKQNIWFVESGVNLRKNETIVKSKSMSRYKEWKLIKPSLEQERKSILIRLGLIPTLSFITA